MFKQFAVLTVLSVSLFSSTVLWAKGGDKPVVVAKLDVAHQLSISAHQNGEEKFIEQVSVSRHATPLKQVQKDARVTGLAASGLIGFGLIYFVFRASRRRIK